MLRAVRQFVSCALMLNLVGADWEPVFVDFFGKKVHLTPEYRTEINEMGEAPVLVHGKKTLSQSGVILDLPLGQVRQIPTARRR